MKKLSQYRCGLCGRQLPYGKRKVVDSQTGREKEETYGRWVMSSKTRTRYCWPSECKRDRRPRRRSPKKEVVTV